MNTVNDGILVPNSWAKAYPRILFLLKEATIRSGWTQIAGVPVSVKCGDNRRFWPNVVLWKHAVTGAVRKGIVPSFLKLEDTYEFRENGGLLDDIAYVNVKKELGGVTSKDSQISNVAYANRESLSSQIDSISPEIVFCCYTIKAYRHIYTNEELEKIGDKVFRHRERIIIEFFHPSIRRAPAPCRGRGYFYEDLYGQLSQILSQPAFLREFPTSRWSQRR
jgi:hypothetical protein